MPADIHTGGPSTSRSGGRARSSSELRLLDLDDLCLTEILVRAVPAQLPWESEDHSPFVNDDPRDRREGESVVYCGRLLRVCRRFRDALLSRATGQWVCNSHALLRFAPRLRRLEIAHDSKQLPWQAVRLGDGVDISPPALAHLTNVTQLELRGRAWLDAGRVADIAALPLLRDLELRLVQITEGPELQCLAALTALTRLQLPSLAAKSAPPDSLECFSRLQALQTFGAPYAGLASASVLRFIAALTALSSLHLQGVFFDATVGQVHRPAEHDALLEIASEACGLNELRFSYALVSADGFSCLTRLTQLTVLELPKSLDHLSVRDLQRIAALPRLRQLALTGEGCARVPPLGALTALERLSLDVDESSGGRRVAGLGALTHLQLRLRWMAQRAPFGQPAIEALATLSSLRELALCELCFDGAAGAAVCTLHGLRRLSLLRCKVTDGALGALTQLHELTLRGGSMETVTQLTLLTGLRALKAGKMSKRLLDAGIATLTQLIRLELDLCSHAGSLVQLPSLVELPRLNSLRDLTVLAPSIGQQDLDILAALHLLTRLRVSCAHSSTATVSRLTALQRLVTLDIGLPSCVAAEDLAALACALPELRQLSANVQDVPSRESELMIRLAHLRGRLHGADLQVVELGLGTWCPDWACDVK